MFITPSRGIGSALVALSSAALLVAACATTKSETDDDQASSPSSASAGGAGGAGGLGGSGASDGCAVDCSAIAVTDCNTAVCNDGSLPGMAGTCVVVPLTDGTACDDGLFCTAEDTCQAGVCVAGPPNDCDLSPGACEQVTCDEAASSCALEPFGNGSPCTSADLCQLDTSCLNGVCGGGVPNDCFLAPVPDECHVAQCNSLNGMCEPVAGNEGAPCVDQTDLCSVGNTCSAGTCLGGSPKDCSALTQGCNLGVCDTTNGMCVAQAVMNGQPCDDLDACTTGEVCSASTCGGGSPVTSCSLTGDGCCPTNCTAVNDLDCQCMTTPITTSFTNTSGWDGIMFDVVAKSAIEVQNFEVNIDTGSKAIEIYYKAGTFLGFETNAAAWTFVGSAVVNPTAPNIGTPVPVQVNVPIPANQTYGFYIVSTAGGTLNNGINYIISVPTGSVQTEDANIQLLGGKGRGTGFMGSTFSDRGLSGTLFYEKCGT